METCWQIDVLRPLCMPNMATSSMVSWKTPQILEDYLIQARTLHGQFLLELQAYSIMRIAFESSCRAPTYWKQVLQWNLHPCLQTPSSVEQGTWFPVRLPDLSLSRGTAETTMLSRLWQDSSICATTAGAASVPVPAHQRNLCPRIDAHTGACCPGVVLLACDIRNCCICATERYSLRLLHHLIGVQ